MLVIASESVTTAYPDINIDVCCPLMDAKRSDRLTGAGIAGALIAAACCAGFPAAVALIGGLTVARLVGVLAGVSVTAGLVAVVALATSAGHRRWKLPTTRRNRTMTIELLYLDGCPNHDALLARLHELLDQIGRRPKLVLRKISDDATAQRERFLGSPTVRIDGRDVEPGADERTDYGMQCRLYATPTRLTGMPTDDWLRRSLAPTRPSAAMRVKTLSDAERALHRRILSAFATGAAPSASQLDTWARELALDPGAAAATLARHDLVHRDGSTGAVTAAYPFSASPTRHRVRLSSGAEVFAMCAIDALGIAFMLGQPTDISSTDPGTGEPIAISLPLTEPAAWSPHDAVVVAGHKGSGASLACTCPHTNFASSPQHARALLEAAPDITGDVLSMPEAIEHGRQTFGGLLERDAQEVAHAKSNRA